MPDSCRASVIIPTWNGRQHLQTCLEALRRQTFHSFELIVVDNGSTDGSQDFIRHRFPEVTLVELGANHGFTGACNAGYAVAAGEIIILLNNDTEAAPDWLAALVDLFDRHPQVGIGASKIMLFDRRDHFHSAGDYYRVDGIPGNRGVWEKDVGQYEREEPVFSACGAAAAYRRKMLEEIGFLDDSFFFSCEDVDIGWRAHLAGWDVRYTPHAVVYHQLKATGGSTTGSYYDGRNFLYVIWKNYPSGLLRRYWRCIVRGQLRITAAALRAWRGEAARARLRGQLAGVRGLRRMWRRRRRIQARRRVSDHALMAHLTAVDGDLGEG
ncbi:MAG: glycosyltransferase family 2 protein [Candidatus Promineifilaceae bacterium]|nr:glycosyltransferase family 2 protein [Candidatus Promineifilaceae bacterium]